ncbi:MAG: hypothetical protein JO259_05305 [Mycobacterium sp.]|nr:hypothetical protein [Mycobacterium sp.]
MTSTSAHPAMTSHHHRFLDSLVNGFAWRTGSDAADTIFHMAPGLIVLVALAALVVYGVRRLRKR